MARAGPLPPRAAAPMLATAALLDGVIVLAVTALLAPQVAPLLREFGLPAAYVGVVVFALLALLAWIIFEFLLGLRSPGRAVLGLVPSDRSGRPLAARAKLRRASGKLVTLGLTGANPFRPARYDEKAGIVWNAPLAPAKAGPIEEWRILILNGSLKSKGSRLGAIGGFRKRGEVRFGRDPSWADVVFSEADGAVSGQHAALLVKNGRLYLRDGNGRGKPSSRGTALAGKRLKPGETRAVTGNQSIRLADIEIKLTR